MMTDSIRKYDIKMIGLDLDGTLLNTEKKLTDHTRNILGRAIERGVTVLPATGRPLTGIPNDIMTFPGIRYAVTANGARIVDLVGNKVLFEKLVPYETGKKILEICSQYDALLEVYYNGAGYADETKLQKIQEYVPKAPMAYYIESTRRPVRSVVELFKEKRLPTDKVQAIFRTEEDCKKAWKKIEKEVPDIEITGALSNNIEVNVKGVNKGKGLLMLGELLGIRREQIMACGDGSNDIAMLKEAGLGVAMENAMEPVKDAADVLTLSNDSDGVAAAIEKYVL